MKKEICKVCGWPYAFPELSVGEAYKKCMEIHNQSVNQIKKEAK